MAFAAGFCQGGAWSGPAYGLHLLQPPAVALERCWKDTDSLFACLVDWEAQVRASSAVEAAQGGSCEHPHRLLTHQDP